MNHPLRPFQRQALALLNNPGHLICTAPTGSGKSLIYERAAIQTPSRAVLVTPLLALGRQQRDILLSSSLRVSACLSSEPRLERFPPRVSPGESGIWIVSPESLQSPTWARAIQDYRPNLWVVDECHCIWEWGTDFRPAYAAVPHHFLQAQQRAPEHFRSLWLTATLLPEHREHLRTVLAQTRSRSIHEWGAFDVPASLDLYFERVTPERRISRLLQWTQTLRGSGIVFVIARDTAERVGRLLRAAGMPAHTYHSGLTPEERNQRERAFRVTGRKIIVATAAFGMGMDLQDLEWSLVWEPPYTPIDLAQRLGRVARGLSQTRATGILFWDPSDWGPSTLPTLRRDWLRTLLDTQCRRSGLRKLFGAPPLSQACDHCDGCVD